ncbi:sulfatase family protein [Novipirellula artificiosorum]|uniref:Arylsulfatase n=1 Tax=Novipirellula artificiosorum TaxID=2528016 RepID=A0A5C6D7V6_9BACT|nr:sulfatase-like hydrolase/transferase [Novipirellula artificiosorum]TWU31797.1 Arylsulfatase [Novipirellula artificiosorum]
MLRPIFVLLLAGCLGGANLAAERPNVVIIVSDDQSWDSIGFQGGKVHTPRLNQMAKDGLYLSDFNVTSTVCSPSRYSFLTGRYAGRCEGRRFMQEHPLGDQTQVENIGELEQDRWNVAKLLQRAGYTTGFVGKSHLVNHEWINGDWSKAGLETYPQNADPREPEVNAKMRRNHQKWCEAIKPFGFDFVDGVYAANLKEQRCDALNVHNLDWTVSKAVAFLEQSKDDPFFLYFSTTLHHGPAPWSNQYSLDADPRMTGEGFVAEGFDVLPSRANVLQRNRAAGFNDRQAYALWLDDGVGAIVDKVEQLGLEEETLIIFVPDHGSYRHGKATLHDYGMRVAMLMQWKGKIKAGSQYDALTANIDITPTILDLCDVAPPADDSMDGVSLKPVIYGSQRAVREELFGEMGHSRCVKTKDWKYIAVRYPDVVQRKIDQGGKFPAFNKEDPPLDRPYLTRNRHLGHYASLQNPHYFEADQLYNLKADPEENENVFRRYPEVAQQMQKRLAKALTQFEERPFGEFTDGSLLGGQTVRGLPNKAPANSNPNPPLQTEEE